MKIKHKLNNTNGWQRLFITISGIYLIALIIGYSYLYADIKQDYDNKQKKVVMSALDIVYPIPKVKTDEIRAILNKLNDIENEEYYVPKREMLNNYETEQVEKLGYKQYFNNLINSTTKYDFKQEIKAMEDVQSSWRYFILLSLPCFLIAWIIPCAIIYTLGLLILWIFKGFKKSDGWIERP